jgi:hypothetical protein
MIIALDGNAVSIAVQYLSFLGCFAFDRLDSIGCRHSRIVTSQVATHLQVLYEDL